MNCYNEIKNKIIDHETYSKESHKVITYFKIGRLLNDADGRYGDHIIDEYAKKLVVKIGKNIIEERCLE